MTGGKHRWKDHNGRLHWAARCHRRILACCRLSEAPAAAAPGVLAKQQLYLPSLSALALRKLLRVPPSYATINTMKAFETSATVEPQGDVRVVGVPFAPGTE